jgi:DNA-binding transcriptional MerR regulator
MEHRITSDGHRLRSGTAARLAGLPVTTLRVWERRYGVVSAAKTDGGQRLYSHHDVSRLRLLRQLTYAGHAIGTIADLELDALQDLASGLTDHPTATSAQPLKAVVIGRSAAHALEAVPGCVLLALHDTLDQAEAALQPRSPVDLLLIRVASLHPNAVDRVIALGAVLNARSILVLYAFSTGASADSLRAAGVTVHREPMADRDLGQWVRDARALSVQAGATHESAMTVAPRRFSDDALAQLTQMQSSVACECLRHMSEIVAQLAGFERYSRECPSTTPEDTELHRQLSRTAGTARTMFEQALQRVVENEGLEVRDGPG